MTAGVEGGHVSRLVLLALRRVRRSWADIKAGCGLEPSAVSDTLALRTLLCIGGITKACVAGKMARAKNGTGLVSGHEWNLAPCPLGV